MRKTRLENLDDLFWDLVDEIDKLKRDGVDCHDRVASWHKKRCCAKKIKWTGGVYIEDDKSLDWESNGYLDFWERLAVERVMNGKM